MTEERLFESPIWTSTYASGYPAPKPSRLAGRLRTSCTVTLT